MKTYRIEWDENIIECEYDDFYIKSVNVIQLDTAAVFLPLGYNDKMESLRDFLTRECFEKQMVEEETRKEREE